MEFSILIFVNLVFLAFFYFLFSIRLGRFSEKTKNSGISKDLYENIELVIRYLDATVETVNQKTDSFYRLVQRADELKKNLEELTKELERKPKSKRKPKSENQTMTIEVDIPEKETSNIKSPSSVAERILNQQTETDRFEFSSSTGDLAQLIGAQKNREKSTSPQSTEGILSGIGRFTRKVLGLPLVLLATKEQQEPLEKPEIQKEHKNQPFQDQYKVDFKSILEKDSENTSIQAKSNREVDEPVTYLRPESIFSNIEIPDLSNPKERADFIRLLLRKPMRVDEISTLTGISLGEIQFVQKVMINTGNRPKNRT